MAKFWMQKQAPAGNWTDSIGWEDLAVDDMQRRLAYYRKFGDKVRVVERVDVVVDEATGKAPRPVVWVCLIRGDSFTETCGVRSTLSAAKQRIQEFMDENAEFPMEGAFWSETPQGEPHAPRVRTGAPLIEWTLDVDGTTVASIEMHEVDGE